MLGKLLSKKFKKPSSISNNRLWKKYVKETGAHTESTEYLPLTLNHIARFADNGDFNLERSFYNYYLISNGAKQYLNHPTKDGKNLVFMMEKNSYRNEFLQVIVHASNGFRCKSKIIKGNESKIDNIQLILELIEQTKNKAERSGERIKKISILHTHPSLEVLATNEKKTTINFHPLSYSDLQTLKFIQNRFYIPVTLSAITANSLQYTCSAQDIFDC